VFVTARPPRTVRMVAHDLGVLSTAICCNGALVYDLACNEVVMHRPIPSEVVIPLIAALRDATPGACFAFELVQDQATFSGIARWASWGQSKAAHTRSSSSWAGSRRSGSTT
jgi:hydroxymethylpyrimidine pyrophosphatase-like HAD family hydrolase